MYVMTSNDLSSHQTPRANHPIPQVLLVDLIAPGETRIETWCA